MDIKNNKYKINFKPQIIGVVMPFVKKINKLYMYLKHANCFIIKASHPEILFNVVAALKNIPKKVY